MFACEDASGTEVLLRKRHARSPAFTGAHKCFSRGCLSSWNHIWLKRPARDKQALPHTLHIYIGNVSRMSGLCHFRRTRLKMECSSGMASNLQQQHYIVSKSPLGHAIRRCPLPILNIYIYIYICVCVCVRERERKRGGKSVCVCVCVCVIKRQSVRMCISNSV